MQTAFSPREQSASGIRSGLHARSRRRRGLACTEAALVLPVLVLFTLSIVDICNVLHLRQKIATVAFETCRRASLKGQTFEAAERTGLEFAAARNIANAQIEVGGTDRRYATRADMPTGEPLTATVRAPVAGNVAGPFLLFRATLIESPPVTMAAR